MLFLLIEGPDNINTQTSSGDVYALATLLNIVKKCSISSVLVNFCSRASPCSPPTPNLDLEGSILFVQTIPSFLSRAAQTKHVFFLILLTTREYSPFLRQSSSRSLALAERISSRLSCPFIVIAFPDVVFLLFSRP